jgi:hypothetical protein
MAINPNTRAYSTHCNNTAPGLLADSYGPAKRQLSDWTIHRI